MNELNSSFKRLEPDVAVSKKVNDVLVKRYLERQCWRNAPYNGRECVEIMGKLSSIDYSRLKQTVCKVLQHIGVEISKGGIESCHRLNKKLYRTIVNFSRRKDCEHVMRAKKDLKKVKSNLFKSTVSIHK